MNLYENYWMDEEDDVRVTNKSKRLTQGEKEMFDEAERQEMEVLIRYKKKDERKKKMQAKRERMKNAIATPLPTLHERDLC